MQEEGKGWHVGREIPLALVVTVLLQTFAAVWWASSISKIVDQQQNMIMRQQHDIDGLIVGAKERSILIARAEEQLKALNLVLSTMDNRQTRIEDKINTILEKVKLQ